MNEPYDTMLFPKCLHFATVITQMSAFGHFRCVRVYNIYMCVCVIYIYIYINQHTFKSRQGDSNKLNSVYIYILKHDTLVYLLLIQ